jgi:hypothetical protein
MLAEGQAAVLAELMSRLPGDRVRATPQLAVVAALSRLALGELEEPTPGWGWPRPPNRASPGNPRRRCTWPGCTGPGWSATWPTPGRPPGCCWLRPRACPPDRGPPATTTGRWRLPCWARRSSGAASPTTPAPTSSKPGPTPTGGVGRSSPSPSPPTWPCSRRSGGACAAPASWPRRPPSRPGGSTGRRAPKLACADLALAVCAYHRDDLATAVVALERATRAAAGGDRPVRLAAAVLAAGRGGGVGPAPAGRRRPRRRHPHPGPLLAGGPGELPPELPLTIEARLTDAVALEELADHVGAIRSLRQALDLAAPEGYRRVFVEAEHRCGRCSPTT